MRHNQVFFDPSGRRKHLVNAVRLLVLALALGGACAAIIGVLYAPEIKAPVEETLENSAYVDRGTAPVGERASYSTSRTRVAKSSMRSIKRYAFYDPSTSGGYDLLKENVGKLDGLLPSFLTLEVGTGRLRQRDAEVEFRARRLIQEQGRRAALFPLLSDEKRTVEVAGLLGSAASRSRLIHSVSQYLHNNSDAGVAIEFNGVPASSHLHFHTFLADLAGILRPAGRKLILVTPPVGPASRLQQLAEPADYVLIKLHQDNGAGIGAAPASQGWFEAQLAAVARTVRRNKLIIGFGSYALDTSATEGSRLGSVQSAWSLMKRVGALSTMDPVSLNPRFRYVDDRGLAHDAWLLDGVTVFNQMRASASYEPVGFALTRLGLEDPSAWASFARERMPDDRALYELRVPEPGHALDPRASDAEVVGLKIDPLAGFRRLKFDARLGLIVKQTLDRVPRRVSYLMPEIADRKLIALTFDDGPHPVATEAMLDILRAKGVKGTFFVIGKNALQHPHIVGRTYAEGHDLGNHTYSHPQLAALNPSELQLELTSTQRILEGILGIHTTLFRPPYQGPSLIHPPETPYVVEAASRLGYVTVLARIIPFDWLNPPAHLIHDRVVRQVLEGRGNIILLHDWGTRKSTLEALPLIIDTLRAREFRFVTLHELINKQRDEVMPPARWDFAAEATAIRHLSDRRVQFLASSAFSA